MSADAPRGYPRTHPIAPSPPARAASFAARAATAAAKTVAPSQFGRMFPRRRGVPTGEQMMVALAATMNERLAIQDPPGADGDNALPAGYTYLGQFIDHDLTFDKRLFSEGADPTAAITNFRTPRFDLDCLYGDGPQADPDLYESDSIRFRVDAHDLRRRPNGAPYIKDRRNDSNRIVSQFHLALAHFHNRVVEKQGHTTTPFASARDEVRRHYQWIAIHDFLERVAGAQVVQSILGGGVAQAPAQLKLFEVKAKPRIPLEFSAAAFRFGHTMVRAVYALNADSGHILTFDGEHPNGLLVDDLRGFRPMPPPLAIDWDFFFAIPGGDPDALQLARPIDTLIAGPLFGMPNSVAQNSTAKGRRLPFRNLHRGEIDLQLATGQEVALAMRARGVPGAAGMKILGLDVPLNVVPGQFTEVGESTDNLGNTGIDIATLEASLQSATPLWYYVLKEAAQFEAGRRLGPVGARIVAEVLIGVMLSDPTSILNAAPTWQPKQGKFGCRQDGEYTIADLLAFARGH